MLTLNKNKETSLVNLSIEGFNAIYQEFYPSMLAYARNFVLPQEAEDIVQDMMVWLWENRKTITIRSTLKGYLFLSIRNNCLTAITKEKNRESVVDYSSDSYRQPYCNINFYMAEELSLRIEEALSGLPDIYRHVFEMNRFENKSYSIIARELNMSQKAIEYRMSQALKRLRQDLKEYVSI